MVQSGYVFPQHTQVLTGAGPYFATDAGAQCLGVKQQEGLVLLLLAYTCAEAVCFCMCGFFFADRSILGSRDGLPAPALVFQSDGRGTYKLGDGLGTM